jgi:ABC-2 type transport system ATP-binding protein
MDLQVKSISRSYSGRTILDSISFDVSKGTVIGLLGLNGAGKSTLLKGLAGVQPLNAGDVICAGKSLRSSTSEYMKLIGYQPEHPILNPILTVEEHMFFTGRLHNISGNDLRDRIADLIDLLELDKVCYAPCSELSKGEAQRLSFALATIHDPTLLLLDEPTSGLDPDQLAYFRSTVLFSKQSRVVVFSTHHLHELESICDKIFMLRQGKIIELESISDISNNKLESYFSDVANL